MPKHSSQVVQERRRDARRKIALRRVRIGLFVAAATVVVGLGALLVIRPVLAVRTPTPTSAGGEVRQVVATMAGFAPQVIRVPAGKPFAVRLVNPDSQFHTDGGGWHQFRVERLSVDLRVPPQSERSQAFAALTPGQYEFYCDICCGGKENPTMRGVIEVTG